MGPDMAYLNTKVVFQCFAPTSSPKILYKLIRDGSFLIGIHVGHKRDWNATFSLKVKAASAGLYQCKATAGRKTGVSNSVKLTVVSEYHIDWLNFAYLQTQTSVILFFLAPASNTRMTSEPSPPVAYEGSSIILSCDVDRGSHLSYTWFFNRKEVTSSTSGFNITGNKLVMGRATPEHSGNYYCVAWSAVRDVRSFSTSTEAKVTVKGKTS